MKKIYILVTISLSFYFSNCQNLNLTNSPDSSETSILAGMLGYKISKLTLSGTAAKGTIQNGLVEVYKLNSNGSCDNNLLGSTFTDINGFYKVNFPRTGGSVCVFIKPDPKGTTLMYDEKSAGNIGIPPSSTFQLSNILEESKINPLKLNSAPVSPLTSALAGRVKALSDLTSTPNTTKILEKAGKEIVIRFGINRSFVSGRSLVRDNSPIYDRDYPTLQDLTLDLSAANNAESVNYLMILAGFSQIANTNKTGLGISSDDIQSAIKLFSDDFADGKFNGKDKSGNGLSFSSTGKALSSNSLSETLLPEIKTYVKEGGKIGFSPNNQVIIPTSDLDKIQFIDNREIISPATEGMPTAPSITFTAPATGLGYHLFNVNTEVNLNPTNTGSTITSCSVTPSLPAGLSLSSSCVISGTPTSTSSQTEYTITAENLIGTSIGTLSIKVNPELKVTYAKTTFLQNDTNSSLTPTIVVTGSITSCSATSLPTGMTLNSTTCVISGTPTAAQAFVSHSITVTDSNGSSITTSALISVTDKTAPTVANTTLTASLTDGTSAVLSWNSATDNFSTVQYAVYYILDETATTPSFDTVSQIEGYSGVKVVDYSSNTSATISGLTKGKSAYYFNVIAKDADGNKTPYAKKMVNTGVFFIDCENPTGSFGGYDGAVNTCNSTIGASYTTNTNGGKLKCNGIRPFISLSGMNLIDAPTYNGFSSSLSVYIADRDTKSVTLFTSDWSSVFTTNLPSDLQTSLRISAIPWTFSKSDGTYDSSNNCSGGTSTSGNGTVGTPTNKTSPNWFSDTTNTCSTANTLIAICY
ncbi:MAG: putative Ig domain-containing protein [Leptospiraceae bacterium]|nr:putative Ig domain-containing protein [Leptospiraceae bacterium]MCP5510936.1 putative Ig domain-containing protein [Leptospiraceae bacterium]